MTSVARRPAVRRWASAAAVVLASGLTLAACSEDAEPTSVSGQTGEPTGTGEPEPTDEPTQEPSTEPSTEPSSEPSSEPSGSAVPVYFAGDGPGGRPRLFREFHRVTGDPLTEAARLVAGGGQPDDPDYRTLWPQMEISSVTATDGVLLVQVPTDGFTDRPDGMPRREARLALQQLVYTLQGVQQDRIPVVVDRPDTEPMLFGLPTDTELTAASPLRTLNLVNITSPAEGAAIAAGDSLQVSGVANSFEANVLCELVVGGRVVGGRAITAEGWTEDRLFPFEGVLGKQEAPAGPATLRCETDDPSGGAEGDGPSTDTKRITLR